jgi:AAA domain
LWRISNVPINTRRAPPTTPSPFPNGSVLWSAVPVASLREERVKVCIYGRNRSGKTSLAAQFPKPLLFISCEPAHCGGVQSVSNVRDVTLIRVEDEREKIVSIGNELAASDHYRTVVLKTVTSLQDVILEEMKREFPGIPISGRGSKDTFQMRSSRLHDTMKPLLDLKRVHVVVLAQEKDHNPPVGEGGFPDLKAKLLQTMQQGSFMAPALGPANAQWLQDACGYVLQLYEDEVVQEISVPQVDAAGNPTAPVVQRVGTGRRQRHLRLLYHPNFAAGGKWQYDPDMPEFVTAPDPAGMYRALAGYLPALR